MPLPLAATACGLVDSRPPGRESLFSLAHREATPEVR
jgi:hypothetical protein